MWTQENIFYCKGGHTLERIAREVVEAPSLEITKTHPDMDLDNLL